MSLTGRFNFTRTLTGKIILQVEEDKQSFWRWFGKRPSHRRWRNARVLDLAQPELRALIDLRLRPQIPLSYPAAPLAQPSPARSDAALTPGSLPDVALEPRTGVTQH